MNPHLSEVELSIPCVRTRNGVCLPSPLPSISLCGEIYTVEAQPDVPRCTECLRAHFQAPDMSESELHKLYDLDRRAASDIAQLIDHEKSRDIWLLFSGLRERYLQMERSRTRLKAALEELARVDHEEEGFVIERTPPKPHSEMYRDLKTKVRQLADNALFMDDHEEKLLGTPYDSDVSARSHSLIGDPTLIHADRVIRRWHKEQKKSQNASEEKQIDRTIDAVTDEIFKNVERIVVKLVCPETGVTRKASIPKMLIEAGAPIEGEMVRIPARKWDEIHAIPVVDPDWCDTCRGTRKIPKNCETCGGLLVYVSDASAASSCECPGRVWEKEEFIDCPDCVEAEEE